MEGFQLLHDCVAISLRVFEDREYRDENEQR
jgi:hypothetical protein